MLEGKEEISAEVLAQPISQVLHKNFFTLYIPVNKSSTQNSI